MSDLRHREGDAGAIDPEGDDFAAQFDREFGAPDDGDRRHRRRPTDAGARRHRRRRRRHAARLEPAAGEPRRVPAGPDRHADHPPALRVVPPTVARRPRGPPRRHRLDAVVTTFIMMRVVHFRPILGDDLIFDDVTPTGGDMGSHVWAPAYLRDHLLPNFQLSGWSMDWYGGLPVYRFYMVIPALAMVALDTVLPYGVAFKLVAISGLVSLPFTCWAFGRLARFRYPLPELFAFAGLCFALNESTTIYGGNVLATMAGEFSFSIAISLMMLGLGLLARGLDDGKGRLMMWAAIVLALACLSHGIVLIYTAVGASGDRRLPVRRRSLAAAGEPDEPWRRRRSGARSRLHRPGDTGARRARRRADPGVRPAFGVDRRRLPAWYRRRRRPVRRLRMALAAQSAVRQAPAVRRLGRRAHPAPLGVLGRAVPLQPRLHDRHEVRVQARRRAASRSGRCCSTRSRSSTC